MPGSPLHVGLEDLGLGGLGNLSHPVGALRGGRRSSLTRDGDASLGNQQQCCCRRKPTALSAS